MQPGSWKMEQKAPCDLDSLRVHGSPKNQYLDLAYMVLVPTYAFPCTAVQTPSGSALASKGEGEAETILLLGAWRGPPKAHQDLSKSGSVENLPHIQSRYGVTLKKDIVGISSVRQTILPLISSKHEGNIRTGEVCPCSDVLSHSQKSRTVLVATTS